MRAGILFVAAMFSAPSALAQSRLTLPAPTYTKVLELESMDATLPVASPDGRWIVYTAARENSPFRNLWIVAAAGGQPRQLTTGNYVDNLPHWFPRGDRLVFSSSRVDGALMTIAIDPASGRATEAPQRLSLDAPAYGAHVSPDGRWVVYSTNNLLPPNKRLGALRIMPSTGGAARTLDSATVPGGGFVGPAFTRDGSQIEYIAAFASDPEQIRRVPASGGRPTVLLHGSSETHFNGRPTLLQFPAGDGIVMNTRPGGDTVWLQSYGGDTVASFTLRGIRPPRLFWKFGSPGALLASTLQSNTEVHVLSTDGGAPRSIRPATPDEYIAGFLTGDRVLLWGRDGSRETSDIYPIAGGGMTSRIVLPDSMSPSLVTIDGKLAYCHRVGGGGEFGVYDVERRSSRVITRSFAGGSMSDYSSRFSSRDEVLYTERAVNGVELRAWSPATSTSRLLRSFPVGTSVRDYALHGDLVAYSIGGNDSITVLVAATPASTPQRVFAARGGHADGLSISRDGRHLAFGIQVINGRDSTHAIVFADVQPNGSLAGSTRLVPVDNITGITWLPNNSEVIYGAINRSGPLTTIMRLSSQPGARPRVISEQERLSFWDFVVSPDGKWVSYPAVQPIRSAIWRVDFPALKGRSGDLR